MSKMLERTVEESCLLGYHLYVICTKLAFYNILKRSCPEKKL